jgi:AraC family transcriptional regulator
MNSAVERAISFIWERYDEQLSLDDISRSAMLSRFHFSRVFKEATGVSPVRFLSAVRIYQAKRMLLNTDLTVTDISFAVGYNSLGSFTNHFTASVGVSPGRFRRAQRDLDFRPHAKPKVPQQPGGVVAGTVTTPPGFAETNVYIGIFRDPIIQSRPIAAHLLRISSDEPHPYKLVNVPDGSWFIHAIGVGDTIDPEPWTRRTLLVGTRFLTLNRSGEGEIVDISLRPRRPVDLPILLDLPDLELSDLELGRDTIDAEASGLAPEFLSAERQ